MEANAPPAGSWNRRLRPPGPGPPVGSRNPASLSPLPWHSRYTPRAPPKRVGFPPGRVTGIIHFACSKTSASRSSPFLGRGGSARCCSKSGSALSVSCARKTRPAAEA
eukprot:scaffold16843_cov72-Phaeocystis_antarctica.AAC.1